MPEQPVLVLAQEEPMETTRAALGLVVLLSLGGCTARELAWLVPRASVGFAIRTHEGQVAGAGFVTLVTPLQRPGRMGRPFVAAGSRSRLHLLGESTPCRIEEVCRWEGRARSGTLADLVEDEMLEGRAP